jgi:ABC-type polysaccharide/polyol phosphate transport system ATPase subunit
MVVNEPIIKVENLTVEYHEYTRDKVFSLGKRQTITALRGINFSLEEGEHVAIIGRNGSGKSTLLKCMAGMLRPSKGTVEIEGRALFLSGVDPGFDSELTGRENVRQLAPAYGVEKEKVESFVESVKEFTELGEAFERKYLGYSGGMKGKLGFGFISDLRSDILMIDETFGAGDREFKKKSKARMNAMVSEIPTLVMCSHGMSLVTSICERGLVINDGELVFDGPVNEAVAHYEKITEDSIHWIEFPYQKKFISENELHFDFIAEFQVIENMRVVIYDNKLKQFILKEELDNLESFSLERSELPEHVDCILKFQQCKDEKWYDASRYIRFTTESPDIGTVKSSEETPKLENP